MNGDDDDLSIFNRMLSSNRSALDDLLAHGAARTRGDRAHGSGEPGAAHREESANMRSGTSGRRPDHAADKGGSKRMNAKSGGISFTFRVK